MYVPLHLHHPTRFVSRSQVGIIALVFSVVLTATVAAQDWNNSGTGDWASAANWSPSVVPSAGDSPAINNGGHATASNSTMTGPIDLFLIDVGTDGGTGQLTVDQLSLTLDSSLDVGDVAGVFATGSGVNVVSDGMVSISNAATLSFGVGGIGDINSGQTSATNGATAMGTGTVNLANITTLQVAGDIDVGQTSGSGQATGNGSVSLQDISSTVSVGSDIDVGQTSAELGGTNHGTGNFVAERIAMLSIGGDLDVGQTTGGGQANGNGFVSFSDVDDVAIGGSLDAGKIRTANGANHSAVADVMVNDSNMTVDFVTTQGSIEVGTVFSSENSRGVSVATLTVDQSDILVANDVLVGSLALGGTSSLNSATGTLHLIDSRLDARDVSVATRLDGTAGAVQGRIQLERSLAIVQGTLLLADNATLAIQVDGTTRALGDGLTTDYGAIDADIAQVAGVLELETAASHGGPGARGVALTFDLITSLFGITGAFDSITYNGNSIGTAPTYVGSTNNGEDGLFASVEQDGLGIRMTEFLALPGDANGDGAVNGADFVIWNTNKFTSGTDWASGDFNGDGVTNGVDFVVWNSNKFTSVDAIDVVPEPHSLSLMLVVLFSALRFRKPW